VLFGGEFNHQVYLHVHAEQPVRQTLDSNV